MILQKGPPVDTVATSTVERQEIVCMAMMYSRLHLKVIASRDRAPLRADPTLDGLPPRRRRFRTVPAAGDEVGAAALTVRVASRDDLRALWRLAPLAPAPVPP